MYRGWHLMSIITFTSTAPIKSPQHSSTFPLANVREREPDKRPMIILLLRCELWGEWSKKGLPQPLTLVYICCILHVRFTGIAAIPSSQQIVYTEAPLRDQQLPRYSYTQSLKQSPNINTSCVDKPTPSRGFSSSVKNCSLYFFFYINSFFKSHVCIKQS